MIKKVNAISSESDIDSINDLLRSVGIHLDRDNMDLQLTLDMDAFTKHAKRNAGRKHIPLKKDGFLAEFSVAEMKGMIKEKTAAEVAKELGVSRRTLFRRLKEAKELGYSTIF
jgi:transcriptional regulator of acetoin/glycerol metabolism